MAATPDPAPSVAASVTVTGLEYGALQGEPLHAIEETGAPVSAAMTWPTVRTTVPFEARGWSQVRNASSVEGLIDGPGLSPQASHTRCNTSGTQPPPRFSALTM